MFIDFDKKWFWKKFINFVKKKKSSSSWKKVQWFWKIVYRFWKEFINFEKKFMDLKKNHQFLKNTSSILKNKFLDFEKKFIGFEKEFTNLKRFIRFWLKKVKEIGKDHAFNKEKKEKKRSNKGEKGTEKRKKIKRRKKMKMNTSDVVVRLVTAAYVEWRSCGFKSHPHASFYCRMPRNTTAAGFVPRVLRKVTLSLGKFSPPRVHTSYHRSGKALTR